MMRVSIIATGIGNVVGMHEPKINKVQEKEKSEDLLQNITNTMKPKSAEQTDLEDFTNPIVEINKDETNKVDTKKKTDVFEGENQQEKPSNIVLDFIKKLSPLKIFNRDKKTEEEIVESPDNVPPLTTNEDGINERKQEEIKINEETVPEPLEEKEEKKEIRSENTDVKPLEKEEKKEIRSENSGNKLEENKVDLEIKKEEKKTVEIQSEMAGLDEKTPEDSKDEKEGKEDLEIPSFLRNQSN